MFNAVATPLLVRSLLARSLLARSLLARSLLARSRVARGLQPPADPVPRLASAVPVPAGRRAPPPEPA